MESLFEEVKLLLKELELPHLVKYVDDITKSVDKVHIAFVGEYNAGKSSLINTLLGKRVVAERDLPTTNRIVLVTHCPVEKHEKLDSFTEQVCINEPRLEHIVLVDTPGLSSAIREHEETLLSYLHKADLIVLVAPSNQPYSKEIEELLELLEEKHSTHLAYVINIFEDPKVYEEDPDKIKRIKEFVREKLRSVLSAEEVDRTKIFAFSIRKVREGESSPLTAEWEEFKKFIFEEVAEQAKRLKFASIKEKLLKLFSGSEILEKKEKFENLERERERWLNLKERVFEYAESVKRKKEEGIDLTLDRLFEELKKDIEEVLAKYGNWDLVRHPDKVFEEIKETVRVKFLVSDHLAEIETLLDYRPEFVKLKKLYPELVVEPTIPARLQKLKNQLVEDVEKLPQTVGKPGKVAKWFAPLGFTVAILGVVFLLLPQPHLKVVGGLFVVFGGITFLIAIYRLLTLKRGFEKAFEDRIERLKSFYSKLYKGYYREQFDRKLSKVIDYIDTHLAGVDDKLKSLGRLLKKVEDVLYKITFKL